MSGSGWTWASSFFNRCSIKKKCSYVYLFWKRRVRRKVLLGGGRPSAFGLIGITSSPLHFNKPWRSFGTTAITRSRYAHDVIWALPALKAQRNGAPYVQELGRRIRRKRDTVVWLEWAGEGKPAPLFVGFGFCFMWLGVWIKASLSKKKKKIEFDQKQSYIMYEKKSKNCLFSGLWVMAKMSWKTKIKQTNKQKVKSERHQKASVSLP